MTESVKYSDNEIISNISFKINEIANFFSVEHSISQFPTPSKIQPKLKAIKTASNTLLHLLSDFDKHKNTESSDYLRDLILMSLCRTEVQRDPSFPSRAEILFSPHPNPAEIKLENSLHEIKNILKWASNSEELIALEDDGINSPHKGNKALNYFIKELIQDIWVDVLQQDIGTSVSPSNGNVNGPLIRFIKKSLEILQYNLKNNINCTDDKLINSLSKSESAIRGIIRRQFSNN